ncbi:hypothetical protein [Isoptericola croceus]|uniref:hypothetical protein n=1 Tax=Isoptericola croceus TaxID=3031406 RepID=UPI0023F8663A|nr:hypothetical protein [Isoptericola croceus]
MYDTSTTTADRLCADVIADALVADQPRFASGVWTDHTGQPHAASTMHPRQADNVWAHLVADVEAWISSRLANGQAGGLALVMASTGPAEVLSRTRLGQALDTVRST